MVRSKVIKRGIAFLIIAAIAVTTGLLTGKAIVDAQRRSNAPIAGPVSDGAYQLPPRGAKVTDYDALQNYWYAKSVMMLADSVSADSLGTAVGSVGPFAQSQASASVKRYDGENVYLEATSLGAAGDIVKVDEGSQAFYQAESDTVYTRAHSAMRKELDAEGAYGYGVGYPASWKQISLNEAGGFVERFGYQPRNFMPMIVDKTTATDSSVTVLDEEARAAFKAKSDAQGALWNLEDGKTYYKISLKLNAGAAENYRRHVWYMSCSAQIPVYKEIAMDLILDENWALKRIDSYENYSVWQKVIGIMEANTIVNTIEVWSINEGGVEMPVRPESL